MYAENLEQTSVKFDCLLKALHIIQVKTSTLTVKITTHSVMHGSKYSTI